MTPEAWSIIGMGIAILIAHGTSLRSIRTSIDKLNERINQVEASLNERINQVEASLNERINQVHERINQVEASLNERINQVHERINQVEARLNERINLFEATLTAHLSHLEVGLRERIVRLEATTERTGEAPADPQTRQLG